jgi:hypothetical protein
MLGVESPGGSLVLLLIPPMQATQLICWSSALLTTLVSHR